MRKHVDEIKDYIFNNLSDEYTFTKKYSEIARDLNITQQQARVCMIAIVREGVLETVSSPSKGVSSNPIYKIKTHGITAKNTNPVEVENDGIKTVVFEGVEIKLVLLNSVGYCIDLSDMAYCTIEREGTYEKIISSNKELFNGHIFEIDGRQMVDRIAVMTLLMKVNIDKVHPLKKNMVISFQSSVVNIMCDSQLRAELYISDKNRASIRNNLNCILELDSNQVNEMLIDLEAQINKQLDGYATKLIQQDRQIHKLEKKNDNLSTQVEIEKKAKMNLITESQELRAKLLDRN